MDVGVHSACYADDTGISIVLWRYGAPKECAGYYYAKLCSIRVSDSAVGVDRLFTFFRSGY